MTPERINVDPDALLEASSSHRVWEPATAETRRTSGPAGGGNFSDDDISASDISAENVPADVVSALDRHWMQRAYEQALAASHQDEVPVGAVIVHGADMIAAAGNAKESLRDPTAHAEMIAITQAAASRDAWRLSGCTLFVTLEPCLMCAGAILQSRIDRVVFAASDPKGGAVTSLYQVLGDSRLNHRCEVRGGVMAESCGNLLSEFFAHKRRMGKK